MTKTLFACFLLVNALTAAAGCEDDGGGLMVDAAPAPDAQAPPPADAAAPRDTGAGETAAAVCPAPTAELECDPPLAEMLPPAGMRTRQCAFDVGSTNVKVIVTSTAAGDRSTIEGERVCKKAMRLRDRVQDAMMMPRPLSETDMDALVAQLKTYGEVCTKEGGSILGAVATQWARTATNPDQIKTWFMEKVGLPLNIITGDQEGNYGYAAATHDQMDRVMLDAGGGSFQVTFWSTGDPKPTPASVKFGHDESAMAVWTKPEFTEYGPARAAYIEELKKLIAAKPEQAEPYAKLKELVAAGKLNKELISLGDSGVILAVEGKLQDAAGSWVDQKSYLERLDERRRQLAVASVMGPKKTLQMADVDAFLDRLAANKGWFNELREECVRKAYGGKVLGHLTLLSFLSSEYGLGPRVVFTSGEMAEGYILEKLR